MSPPKRRWTLSIEVTGDTWEDVAQGVRELLPHIEDHGERCSSVSGGYSSGHWVNVCERPEMTHEKYQSELEEFIADHKSRPTS